MEKYQVSIWGGKQKRAIWARTKEEAKTAYRQMIGVREDVPVDAVAYDKLHTFFSELPLEEEEQEITELEPEEQLEEMEGDKDKLSKAQWDSVRRY